MPVILSTLPIFHSEFAKEFVTSSFFSDRIAMSMDSFVDMRSTSNIASSIRETLSLDVLAPPPGLGHTNLSLQWRGHQKRCYEILLELEAIGSGG